MSDRRNQSSSPIRDLFNEQIRNVMSLRIRRQRRRTQELKLDESVELLIEHTDGKLRILSDYKKQLRDCVQTQIQFVNKQANRLFKPIEFTADNYQHNALLNAVFFDEDEIFEVLKNSKKLQKARQNKALRKGEALYVLMQIFPKQKTVFAPALVNGHVINDVKQSQFTFDKKSLLSFTQNEEAYKELLENHLHLQLVDNVKSQLVPAIAAARGRECLIPTEQADNPNVYMAHLQALMQAPEKAMQLEAQCIRTNRFGIAIADNAQKAEREFRFKQIQIEGQDPYLLLPVIIKSY